MHKSFKYVDILLGFARCSFISDEIRMLSNQAILKSKPVRLKNPIGVVSLFNSFKILIAIERLKKGHLFVTT